MTITFYVSIRPIINKQRLIIPQDQLNNAFRGIPLKWACVSAGIEDDGRWLYKIETDTLDHQAVIIEGLAAWGAHLKDVDSAVELTKKLMKGAKVSKKGGKVHVAPTDPEI